MTDEPQIHCHSKTGFLTHGPYLCSHEYALILMEAEEGTKEMVQEEVRYPRSTPAVVALLQWTHPIQPAQQHIQHPPSAHPEEFLRTQDAQPPISRCCAISSFAHINEAESLL